MYRIPLNVNRIPSQLDLFRYLNSSRFLEYVLGEINHSPPPSPLAHPLKGEVYGMRI